MSEKILRHFLFFIKYLGFFINFSYILAEMFLTLFLALWFVDNL